MVSRSFVAPKPELHLDRPSTLVISCIQSAGLFSTSFDLLFKI
jgi:hypothetical protein